MLRKLTHALLWTIVMARSRAGKIPEALEILTTMEKRFGLRPYEQAFKYSLLLREGQYDVAEKRMEDFIKANAHSLDNNTKYAVHYCEYILHGINGDLDQKRSARVTALEVKCDAGVKHWLPL